MGFFGQTGSFAQGDYAAAEPGTYKCILVDVDLVERPSFEDAAVMEKNYRWRFETVEVGDEQGKPFRFSQFTKTSYGYDMAKLTKLLDGMLGRRLTQDEFSRLDLEDLKSRHWSVAVDLVHTSRGKEINTILGVKPWQTKVQPVKKLAKTPVVAMAVEDEITDPFED